ncbi:MAG: TatD family hydrolase [Verrucomicrobiota bacterium]
MLIDTHAHLDFPDFQADLPEVIARAADAGVTEIIAIGTRVETSAAAIRIAEKFPNVRACVGIHPIEVGDAPEDAIAQLRELARHPRVVAIGEIGLDYHAPDPDPAVEAEKRAKQARLFREQLELAAELGLNANLHIREGYDPVLWADAIRIITPFTGRLRACFHCFKAGPEQVAQVVAMGHIVSFTGFVTYPELPQIPKTAAQIPASTFMLETDCPFMHPMPESEKRCEPAQVRTVAEVIAGLRGVSVETLAAETTATAHAFYAFNRAP